MNQIAHRILRFDRFALDLTRGCLRSGDKDIDLRPKAFEVLRYLAQNAGRLVAKQELYEAVWPNVVVGDDSLVQCIRELRQKLGDDDHRLIKTVSRRGYLLDATVATPAVGEAGPSIGIVQPLPDRPALWLRDGRQKITASLVALHQLTRGARWPTLAAAASALVLASAAAVYLLARPTMPIGNRDQPPAELPAAAVATHSLRRTFKDCNVCPEMVPLPAGEFMMGSPKDERGREQAEGFPRRVVIAKPFAIGKFEVTVDQFSTFIAETGTAVGSRCRLIVKFDPVDEWGPPEASFRKPGYDVTGSHPVSCVSWHEAQAYVAWLRRRTGKPYRLPTEAEWEYAARAGTTTSYSFGDDETQLCAYGRFPDLGSRFAWRGACRSDTTTYGPVQVGKLKANPWGLFDMHGNVWEWVEDCWTANPLEIPTDGSAFTRPGSCEVGVVRGGSWASGIRRLRSAARFPLTAASHYEHMGLRVALSLDAP